MIPRHHLSQSYPQFERGTLVQSFETVFMATVMQTNSTIPMKYDAVIIPFRAVVRFCMRTRKERTDPPWLALESFDMFWVFPETGFQLVVFWNGRKGIWDLGP